VVGGCTSGRPERATATGALLLAGNLGGVILVLLVQAVVGNPYAALLVMSATALPGIAIAYPPAPGDAGPGGRGSHPGERAKLLTGAAGGDDHVLSWYARRSQARA